MKNGVDDCIHLHACRRYSKIVEAKKGFVARGCGTECSAYVSGDFGNYIDVDEAIAYARDGASSIERGYGSYDVYCSCDLQGQTLNELIEEAE